MALTPGTRLGPYEIVAPLGAGGMGEVYEARDTRLDRTVAVKVLPAHLSANEEVRQRFEREARTVSSLNHPNICTLHDVGREGDIDYLVMEYLEGDTLQARLEKGPLERDELLRVAIEIADALDRAHRTGLVHRDLKPGNIMLTPSGAKLLDFGLARTAALSAAGTDLTQSPTMSRPLTAEGMIVGTFQYMAPEQIEAGEADARTDIFAFGAVLYEMATGARAFTGKTQASLIASILKEEPRPIGEVQPMTPPALDRVVRRCLAKDPDDRWQTARDLMLELQWIADGGSSAGVPAPVRTRRRSRERLAWAAAAVFAVAAVAAGVSRLMVPPPPPPPIVRFALLPPVDATVADAQAQVKVSPDGSALAFFANDSVGVSRIWVRRLDSRSAHAIPGTENTAGLPFWSPDSRSIAFFGGNGKLIRVSTAEGNPQIICDAADGRGAAWGSQDVIVFAPSAGGPLYKVPAGGGRPVQATALDTAKAEDGHRWPDFLPDGRHFLFVGLPARDGLFTTYVGSIDSQDRKPVVSAAGAAVYASGYLLFGRDQGLVAQPFDTERLELVGSPMPVGEEPGNGGQWTGSPNASASQNGVLVLTRAPLKRSRLAWFDRGGRRVGVVPLPAGTYQQPDISPDGERLAYTAYEEGTSSATSDIWAVDLARGVTTRFTFDPASDYNPFWSPSGDRIVFSSDRLGSEELFVKPTDGSAEETQLFKSTALFTKPDGWSPDGKYIIFHTLGTKNGFDLWLFRVDGGREPSPLIATPFNEIDARVSPDGAYMAYRSDETGQWELYIQSFPTPGNKYRVSMNGAGDYGEGGVVGWKGDGSEFIYISGDNTTVMSVPVETSPRLRAGTPHPLFRLPAVSNRSADMTADAQKFIAVVPANRSSASAVAVVLNWMQALDNR